MKQKITKNQWDELRENRKIIFAKKLGKDNFEYFFIENQIEY